MSAGCVPVAAVWLLALLAFGVGGLVALLAGDK